MGTSTFSPFVFKYRSKVVVWFPPIWFGCIRLPEQLFQSNNENKSVDNHPLLPDNNNSNNMMILTRSEFVMMLQLYYIIDLCIAHQEREEDMVYWFCRSRGPVWNRELPFRGGGKKEEGMTSKHTQKSNRRLIESQ